MADAASLKAFDQQMESEFLDEARDIVNSLEVMLENVRSHAASPAEALASMRRDIVNLRMLGKTVNLPAVTVVTHRMADYVAELTTLDDRRLADMQAFADKLRAILDGETNTEDAANLARALPVNTADFATTPLNIEVMLVIPEKAMAHIIGRELRACGYRVSNVRSPFEALEMAVRTKPDMVLAALTLEGISGVDLGCMLSACARTQTIPFALLTSYSWGHPELQGLPTRAALIRKGPQFGDDLAEALARFKIT